VKKVKIADLKNNLSRHLLYVRDGGVLTILDRDTPVARIVPFEVLEDPDAGALTADPYWARERLALLERKAVITRSRARPEAGWADARRPTKLPAGTPNATELLLQMRRESGR
jgi:antitoxin (DNA-binding transcriptional repressor) of toxin-antitoxin stability system